MEQKFYAAQERPTVEQAVPLQSMRSMWSIEESTVQQWMWPDRSCSPWRRPRKIRLWTRAAAYREEPAVEQEVWESCCLWGPVLEQCAPEGLALWYRAMLEQHLESCSL